MAKDNGTGVSRTLEAVNRMFQGVVFQKGRPPLDSELNLQDDIHSEALRQAIKAAMPSGFLMDPTRASSDYQFNPEWSNMFKLGNPREPRGVYETPEQQSVILANVNGWVLPIVGTLSQDLTNVLGLMPPPETDTRTDYVFLEVWQARVDPNPSTKNKPSASTLHTFGNVLFGGVNLVDDLEDPTIAYATTGRIQTQYRLRIQGGGSGLGSSVALDVYPDGLGDPYIYGQGTATTPQAALGRFENMREALGDPGLWRAGDGNPDNGYGTVDGYVYAIPVCAVFRRSSDPYLAINGGFPATQNGGFNRTPSARFSPNPTYRELLVAEIAAPLPVTGGVSAPYVLSVSRLNGCGLEDVRHVLASTFLVIDDEIVGVSAVDLINGTITIPAGGRGRYGTAVVGHAVGAEVRFYNTRPDGLYSDQIAPQDVLDLRHAVNAQDWDYNRLLVHNVASLVKGTLRSSWKMSATGPTAGVVAHEVDYLYAGNGALAPHDTEPVDGPDGIRTVWSDAATLQPDVTVLCDNAAPQDGGTVGITNDTFDATVSWDTGADFHPAGFMNSGNATWTDGSTILLFSGGETGNQGVRSTFRTPGTRGARLVTPKEYWKSGYPVEAGNNGNQNPVTLRFLQQKALEPSPPGLDPADAQKHVGPMYPWRETNFERPFIVLGGILNQNMRITGLPATNFLNPLDTPSEIDVGLLFDLDGAWYTKNANGDFDVEPTAGLANPLFHGMKTLYGMLTDGGRDQTGASSEVYVVLYGDSAYKGNNGVFQVIGAGTVGYTMHNAANDTSIVVRPVSSTWGVFDVGSGGEVTVEFRSQYTHAEDTSVYNPSRIADIAIVLTDIGGLTEHPWKAAYLGSGEAYDLSLPMNLGAPAVPNKLLISTTFQYHPGHGATARVADEVVRFSRVGGNPSSGPYLRQAPGALDSTFVGNTGAPGNETYWDSTHVQLWNRLPALGWFAPHAPNYGGNVVGFTEQDREHELFLDRGSKSVIFRPFRSRDLTLATTTHDTVPNSLVGPYAYPVSVLNVGTPKDGLEMFTGTGGTGKKMAFAVPREYMPRFGRQDIPYYQNNTAENPKAFLPGINHLFRDVADVNSPVFDVIGGPPNLGTPGVKLMLFLTGINGVSVPYGAPGTTPALTNNQKYLGARKTNSIDPLVPHAQGIIDRLAAVNSSDFGRGLKGIQLPPYYGPARVIGVYDARDFVTKGGRTINSVDRYSPEADAAPNLLKEDSDQQTLFILRDGARDLTGSVGDHTYILPSNTLDLTRVLQWNFNAPTAFEDFHFVVVCETFGFARDFINGNNFVLVRKYDGAGAEIADGDDPEVEGMPMVIPCPASYNDQFYVAYNRTVYQGDVYSSRQGDAKTGSDYDNRYGQLTSPQQYAMRTPIQQYDAAGNFVPETPNVRAFEVLASLDFYTTMGTGKIGGQLYPGTPLDVGFVENTPQAALRKPESENAPMWQVFPRAFTEGQKSNDNRAQIDLVILDNGDLDAGNRLDPADAGLVAVVRFDLLDGTSQDLWFSYASHVAALQVANPSVEAEDIILVDETSHPQEFTASYTFPALSLAPGASTAPVVVSVPGVLLQSSVIINHSLVSPMLGTIRVRGQVTGSDEVSITVANVVTPAGFRSLGATSGSPTILEGPFSLGGVDVPAHGTLTLAAFAFPGAATASNQVAIAAYLNLADEDDLFFTAEVTAANVVTVTAHNPTAAPLNWGLGGTRTLQVAVLDSFDIAAHTYTLTGQTVNIRVLQTLERGEAFRTAKTTANVINAHSVLKRSVTARVADDARIHIEAVPTGAEGNGIKVGLRHLGLSFFQNVTDILRLDVRSSNLHPVGAKVTKSPLLGGKDYPMNAGGGYSQVSLTGMTERLPLGALLQDSDFLCENPLGDNASAMKSSPVGPRPIQAVIPFTEGGDEFTRFMGDPGELLATSDGAVSVLNFSAWRQTNPTGSRIFRLYRGGGPAFVLSGDNPGGPVDWVSETFPAAVTPVLKGGALACRAMLVRNFYEEVNPRAGPIRATDGDEIQMVVVTYGVLGDTGVRENGMTLSGVISPAGYGEGYAAADRFRLAGRPMFKGYSRNVADPASVNLAVYPDGQR